MTIFQKIQVWIFRKLRPGYYYGYFAAMKYLETTDDRFNVERLFDVYTRLTRRDAANTYKFMLPWYDPYTWQDFAGELIYEYYIQVAKDYIK